MAKQSMTFKDFNPTGDDRVTAIKGRTDELIELVRGFTGAGGPETKRRASLAVTHYENASMWAVKAIFSEDAIAGDDGGAKGPDRTVSKRATDVVGGRVVHDDPNDEGLDGIDPTP